MVTYATPKSESPVESTPVVQSVPYDFDTFAHETRHGLPPYNMLQEREQQTHWSHPGPVPPQQSFESAFQASLAPWPGTDNLIPQSKADTRTVPTVLDGYEAQLKIHEGQRETPAGEMRPKKESEEVSSSSWGAGPQSMMDIDERHGQEEPTSRPAEQISSNSVCALRGRTCPNRWVPSPGWRESLLPDHQAALKYLEEHNKTVRKRDDDLTADPQLKRDLAEKHTSEEAGQPNLSQMSPSERADTQMQRMLLDAQDTGRNMKKRTQKMVSQGHQPLEPIVPFLPPNMSPAEYQRQLMLLEQQCCKRMKAAKQEQAATQKPVSNGRLDYPTQLLLLEKENKKRLLQATKDRKASSTQDRASFSATATSCRGQSVDSDSTWSTQFTPESTPGFLGWDESSDNLGQTPMDSINIGLSSQQPQNPALSSIGHQPYQELDWVREMRNRMKIIKQRALAPPSGGGNDPFISYREQLAVLDEYNLLHNFLDSLAITEWETPAVSSSQRMQADQMLAAMMAQQDRQVAIAEGSIAGRSDAMRQQTALAPYNGERNHALKDYQTQLAILEQKCPRKYPGEVTMEDSGKAGLLRQMQGAQRTGDSRQAHSGEVEDQEWMLFGRRETHKRPLVVRERPTCDD